MYGVDTNFITFENEYLESSYHVSENNEVIIEEASWYETLGRGVVNGLKEKESLFHFFGFEIGDIKKSFLKLYLPYLLTLIASGFLLFHVYRLADKYDFDGAKERK